MAIVISQNGKNAVRVDKTAFEKESHLQKYISDNPDCVPIYELAENNKWLILARELPTNSGYIDALGVDQFGDIYVIETKLYKNPDKRMVVAQMLDYGAALWKHGNDFDEFLAVLDEHTQKTFKFGYRDKIKDYFGFSDLEIDELIEKIRLNLKDGAFRFVALMDKVDDRLKDLILYINENSQFDIYAVELEYYKHDSYEILIPKLFGAGVKKDLGAKSVGIKWTWDLFKERLAESGELAVNAAQKIIDWAEVNGVEIDWGLSKRGSFILCFYADGKKGFFPFSVTGDAMIRWNAPHQGDYSPPPFDKKEKRAEILERIRAIKGATVDNAKVDGYSAFKLPLSVLAEEEAQREFFSICLWIKKTLDQ